MSEDVGEADCLEQCEGTVVDVQRLDGVRDEEGMAKFIRDYERYKYPDWDNLTYPEGMKSKRLFVFYYLHIPLFQDLKFKSHLKFVQISISTSTFDNIKKVGGI